MTAMVPQTAPGPRNRTAGASQEAKTAATPKPVFTVVTSTTRAMTSTTTRMNTSKAPLTGPEAQRHSHAWDRFMEVFLSVWEWIMKELSFVPIPPVITFVVICSTIVLGLIGILLFLCSCKRKRKKPPPSKDKIDLSKIPLFGPEYDEILPHHDEMEFLHDEMTDGSQYIRLAMMRFSVEFDANDGSLSVTIHEANDIPPADENGFSDPYVKVSLVPDTTKTVFKTKVAEHTLNPVFNEKFVFTGLSYSVLTSKTLCLDLYDFDRFSTHDMLCEIKVVLSELDLSKCITETRLMMPQCRTERGKLFGKSAHCGDICVTIGYLPAKSLLVVYVLQCRKLVSAEGTGSLDPFVKLSLMKDNEIIKVRKTTFKKRTANPIYRDCFSLRLNLDCVESTSIYFQVYHFYPERSNELLGQVIVGALASGAQLKHWDEVRKSPGKPVTQWHKLVPGSKVKRP